jgi:hypothetical protein
MEDPMLSWLWHGLVALAKALNDVTRGLAEAATRALAITGLIMLIWQAWQILRALGYFP